MQCRFVVTSTLSSIETLICILWTIYAKSADVTARRAGTGTVMSLLHLLSSRMGSRQRSAYKEVIRSERSEVIRIRGQRERWTGIENGFDLRQNRVKFFIRQFSITYDSSKMMFA